MQRGGNATAKGRATARLVAAALLILPGPALANDGPFNTAFATAGSAEVADDGPRITIGRDQDLVGQPIDIVAASRAALAAGKVSAAGLRGSRPSGMPVSARYMTSGFGGRFHPLLGGYRQHAGVDLAAASGSPIYATSDGVVSNAGWAGGYGLLVQLNHGGGMESRYAHMSQVAVSAGQQVRKGQVIGYVGSTGRSTGPHLHYEVRVNGAAIDPSASLRGR